jgi:light-regulated signal transduction histidine kinase (bacteriophytochrome)
LVTPNGHTRLEHVEISLELLTRMVSQVAGQISQLTDAQIRTANNLDRIIGVITQLADILADMRKAQVDSDKELKEFAAGTSEIREQFAQLMQLLAALLQKLGATGAGASQ